MLLQIWNRNQSYDITPAELASTKREAAAITTHAVKTFASKMVMLIGTVVRYVPRNVVWFPSNRDLRTGHLRRDRLVIYTMTPVKESSTQLTPYLMQPVIDLLLL